MTIEKGESTLLLTFLHNMGFVGEERAVGVGLGRLIGFFGDRQDASVGQGGIG
ncbi:MAG: hypothetical protein QW815_04795 [Nitrososphaerota archaeon]